jgi:hypothetical protein
MIAVNLKFFDDVSREELYTGTGENVAKKPLPFKGRRSNYSPG